jgi:hypothetical protein
MKRFLFAVILCLLPISIANAECAWLLWLRASKDPIAKEGRWEVKKALQTFQQCQGYKNEEIDRMAEEFKKLKLYDVKVNQGESILVIDHANREITFLECSCFPDTIDPRK